MKCLNQIGLVKFIFAIELNTSFPSFMGFSSFKTKQKDDERINEKQTRSTNTTQCGYVSFGFINRLIFPVM